MRVCSGLFGCVGQFTVLRCSHIWTACTHGYCVKSASNTLMGFGNISLHKIMCHANIAYWGDRESRPLRACYPFCSRLLVFLLSIWLYWFFHVANIEGVHAWFSSVGVCVVVCLCSRMSDFRVIEPDQTGIEGNVSIISGIHT